MHMQWANARQRDWVETFEPLICPYSNAITHFVVYRAIILSSSTASTVYKYDIRRTALGMHATQCNRCAVLNTWNVFNHRNWFGRRNKLLLILVKMHFDAQSIRISTHDRRSRTMIPKEYFRIGKYGILFGSGSIGQFILYISLTCFTAFSRWLDGRLAQSQCN